MRLENVLPLLILSLTQVLEHIKGQLILDRSVSCQSNDMRVAVQFAQPFDGVVYADKYFQSPECRWDGNGTQGIVVSIPLNANPARQPFCGVQVNEVEGEFSVTLVLSPIKNILVEGMEGLTVRCIYTMGDVTLTLPAAGSGGAGLFISPQSQAGVVTGSGGSPFLQMIIRDGHGITGEQVQSAKVGQRITLDVVMQDTTIYDFWVHDCYAHDGTNSPDASISIVDTNGCVVRLARAIDPPVFETSPVPNGAKHVYVHMYGFQFTTSQLVYFECQVRPCLQTCNRAQCLGDTSASSQFFSRIRRQAQNPDNYNLTAVIRIEAEQRENEVIPAVARDSPAAIAKTGTDSRICLSIAALIAAFVAAIVICSVALFIAVYLCHKARKETKQDDFTTIYTGTTLSECRRRLKSMTPSPGYTPTSLHDHPKASRLSSPVFSVHNREQLDL